MMTGRGTELSKHAWLRLRRLAGAIVVPSVAFANVTENASAGAVRRLADHHFREAANTGPDRVALMRAS